MYQLVSGMMFFLVHNFVYAENPLYLSGHSDLDLMVMKVIKNYPSIKAHDATIESLNQSKIKVTSWDDPKLSLAIANLPVDTFNFDQEAMTQKKIGLSQKIYASGKLQQRGKVIEKRKDVVKENQNQEIKKIIKMIKVQYFNYHSLQIEKIFIKESELLLQKFINIARKKYEVGQGNQTSILEAEVQLSKLMERIINIDNKTDVHLQKINRYLEYKENFTPVIIEHLTYSKLTENEDHLISRMLENNPKLRQLQSKRDTLQAKKQLVSLNRKSDYVVGLNYGQRDRDPRTGNKRSDFISFQVSMNLPFVQGRKRGAEMAEVRAEDLATIKSIEDQTSKFRSELLTKMTNLNSKEKLIKLYTTAIIPQKNQSLQTALSNYQTDRIDFLFLLKIERELLGFKINMAKFIFNYDITIAELEEIIGQPLNTVTTRVMELNHE